MRDIFWTSLVSCSWKLTAAWVEKGNVVNSMELVKNLNFPGELDGQDMRNKWTHIYIIDGHS